LPLVFSALQEPKGRLIPEGKLKTLNRLLTISGYMNGLEGIYYQERLVTHSFINCKGMYVPPTDSDIAIFDVNEIFSLAAC